MKCCVPLCNKSTKDTSKRGQRITFHSFPTTPWLRKSWLQSLAIDEGHLRNTSVVCSQHFQSDNFYETDNGLRHLRSNAVPFCQRYTKNVVASAVQVCLICLDTASKLYPIDKYNLSDSYSTLNGISVNLVQKIISVPMLCTECAHRLTNFNQFRAKSLRAHMLLWQLTDNSGQLTIEKIKKVNRVHYNLTSNIVQQIIKPDYWDIYLKEEEIDPDSNFEEHANLNQIKLDTDYETIQESKVKVEFKNVHDSMLDFEIKQETIDLGIEYGSDDGRNVDDDNDETINIGTANEVKVTNNNETSDNVEFDIQEELDFDIDYESDHSSGVNNKSQVVNKGSVNDVVSIDDDSDNEMEFLKISPTRNCDETNSDRITETKCLNGNKSCDMDSVNEFDKYVKFLNENLAKNSEMIVNDREVTSNRVQSSNKDLVSLCNVILVKDKLPEQQVTSNKDTPSNIDKVNFSDVILVIDNLPEEEEEEEVTSNRVHPEDSLNNFIYVKDKLHEQVTSNVDKKSRNNGKREKDKSAKTQGVTDKVVRCRRRSKVNANNVKFSKKLPPKINFKIFKITKLTHEEQLADLRKRMDSENYKYSPHVCEICWKGFVNIGAYERHMERHTNKFGVSVCPVCRLHYSSKNRVRKHVYMNHECRYECTLCPFVTKNDCMAAGHERWHNGTRYTCNHCGAVFAKGTSYLSHMRVKHPSDVACAFCGYCFINAKGLAAHMHFMHHFTQGESPSGPFCKTCDIRFASVEAYEQHIAVSSKHVTAGRVKPNTPVHIRTPLRHVNIICEQCGVQVKGKTRYRQHMALEHNGMVPKSPEPSQEFICDQCGKVFRTKAILRQHLYTHVPKCYKCDVCGKGFTFKSNLLLHMEVHSDSRTKYECAVCGKSFSYATNRHRHMLSHSEKRPLWFCKVCDKSFTSAASRNSHVSHVHDNVPWPKRFRNQRPLNTAPRPLDTTLKPLDTTPKALDTDSSDSRYT